jgi:hypothetical protein
MVSEDDPQWVKFWNRFPLRVAKKEARTAWAALDPDPALVDRMVRTLDWQVPMWATQGYGTPYPASWLRAERWTDEPPAAAVSLSLRAPGDPWWYQHCPHTPKCGGFRECNDLKREASTP